MTTPVPPSERRIVFLIGAIQFINVLDFVMVMPLGPDFAHALHIPTSKLGLVGGSYTAAAAVASILGAFFLDRFDRRSALGASLAGLVVGTAAGGFATGLSSLIAARVVAGAFGGPATALSLAIISEAVPPERRGRAMGAVMGAFSVASVLGVPAGLELARIGSWRTPFLTVAALGLIVTATAVRLLPPQIAHLAPGRRMNVVPIRKVLGKPVVLLALAGTGVAMVANFAMIPNLSAYFQFNRGFPRSRLGLLYLIGGVISFGTLRLAGWMTDRWGSSRVAAGGALAFVAVLLAGFIYPVSWAPVLAVFVGFMICGSFRFVPLQTLSSLVPAPDERARFMSARSAVQHLFSAAGAMIGAQVLSERADGRLVGMERLAWFAVAMALLLPPLLFGIETLLTPRTDGA